MAEKQTVLFPGLRGEMAKKGVSVRDLAEVLDTSDDSIYRRLNGIVEFDLSEIVKILAFFNCSFEKLFGEDEAA